MPHGSTRVGEREVVALCDAVVLSEGERTDEAFPGIDEETWTRMRARFPDSFGPNDIWQLHIHAFLIRGGGPTVLFDTGVGPRRATAFAWTGTEGALARELISVGGAREKVDHVVISHAHDDHTGWTVDENGEPMFPDATIVIQRADHEILRGGEHADDAAMYASAFAALDAAGSVRVIDGDTDLAPGLSLRHSPGHTPGHQMLLVDGDPPLLLAADTTNHPVQLEQPTCSSTSDFEPELAAASRKDVLRQVFEQGWRYSTSHFAEPFGRLDPVTGGGWAWAVDE